MKTIMITPAWAREAALRAGKSATVADNAARYIASLPKTPTIEVNSTPNPDNGTISVKVVTKDFPK